MREEDDTALSSEITLGLERLLETSRQEHNHVKELAAALASCRAARDSVLKQNANLSSKLKATRKQLKSATKRTAKLKHDLDAAHKMLDRYCMLLGGEVLEGGDGEKKRLSSSHKCEGAGASGPSTRNGKMDTHSGEEGKSNSTKSNSKSNSTKSNSKSNSTETTKRQRHENMNKDKCDTVNGVTSAASRAKSGETKKKVNKKRVRRVSPRLSSRQTSKPSGSDRHPATEKIGAWVTLTPPRSSRRSLRTARRRPLTVEEPGCSSPATTPKSKPRSSSSTSKPRHSVSLFDSPSPSPPPSGASTTTTSKSFRDPGFSSPSIVSKTQKDITALRTIEHEHGENENANENENENETASAGWMSKPKEKQESVPVANASQMPQPPPVVSLHSHSTTTQSETAWLSKGDASVKKVALVSETPRDTVVFPKDDVDVRAIAIGSQELDVRSPFSSPVHTPHSSPSRLDPRTTASRATVSNSGTHVTPALAPNDGTPTKPQLLSGGREASPSKVTTPGTSPPQSPPQSPDLVQLVACPSPPPPDPNTDGDAPPPPPAVGSSGTAVTKEKTLLATTRTIPEKEHFDLLALSVSSPPDVRVVDLSHQPSSTHPLLASSTHGPVLLKENIAKDQSPRRMQSATIAISPHRIPLRRRRSDLLSATKRPRYSHQPSRNLTATLKRTQSSPITPASLDASFERTESTKRISSQNPKHYKEVVRKRAERELLPARECADCEKFYNALVEGNGAHKYDRSIFVSECSRHRARDPQPKTPPDYWDLEFGMSVTQRSEQRTQRSEASVQPPPRSETNK